MMHMDAITSLSRACCRGVDLIGTVRDSVRRINLARQLREWGYSVCNIHGGMKLADRIGAEKEFRGLAQFMVATEAAGEGINLQFCKVMINWDLPWNPNRLEQRMGRIHRYGQEYEVEVVNLVATNNAIKQPVEFDNRNYSLWHKTRGRNCRTSSRTNCGPWSSFSDELFLLSRPTGLSVVPLDERRARLSWDTVHSLMVHEAGHALGLSDFSFPNFWDTSVAHPSIPNSVMNYDNATGVFEPDCSPHPLDIMAIEALYQVMSPQ